jgi:hypothetical protein
MPLRMRLRQYEAPCFDLTGQRFGLLTAVKKVGKSVGCNGVQWLCKCQCGGSKVVGSVLLRRGKTSSCGCLKRGPRPQAWIEAKRSGMR